MLCTLVNLELNSHSNPNLLMHLYRLCGTDPPNLLKVYLYVFQQAQVVWLSKVIMCNIISFSNMLLIVASDF